jgi:hypothetical protein
MGINRGTSIPAGKASRRMTLYTNHIANVSCIVSDISSNVLALDLKNGISCYMLSA